MRIILKNISYTFFGNIIGTLISILVTFVVPRQISVESYGYFQLYLFYVSYTGFFHFGWADGIFLRYGGEYYDKLNKSCFSGQFWLYSIMEFVIGFIIATVGWHSGVPTERALVLAMTGISVLLLSPKILLQYILQGTNRIKEYVTTTIFDRFVYIVIVGAYLISGGTEFSILIVADLMGKACSLVYCAYQCHDILSTKPEPFIRSLVEAKANISVGIKLMFANIASTLIIGFVRFSIKEQWDVSTFGKVSLTMLVSNMLMIFIRAVSQVMFPALRRTANKKLTEIYSILRTMLMLPMLGMLTLCYPVRLVLSAWLPQYADSLSYMALLFPICIYESKMSMLIETYLKTLRKEKWLLLVNVCTVTLSLIITAVTAYILHNLDLTIASIVVLLAFRCVFAEMLLSCILKVQIKVEIVWELVLTVIFISGSWFIGGTQGVLLYLLAYVLYIIHKRHDINILYKYLKRMTGKAI